MATFDSHPNIAISAVANSPGTAGTTLTVAAGTGARFAGFPFNATVWDASTVAPTPTNSEIVRITARSTDSLTIVRTQEGTSARNIVAGDQIAVTITSKTVTDIETALNAIVAALPDSGALVTTAGPTTVAVNQTYRIDTTSNAVARTLPSAPTIGSQVLFKVVGPSPLSNLFTWATSGSDVVNKTGGATTSTLKVNGAWALFTYLGSNIWLKQEGEPIEQLDSRYAPINTSGFSGLAWGYVSRDTQSDAGYSTLTGCLVTANGTPTKLDIAAGIVQMAPGREQAVAQASAWSGTITSLSDATNPRWAWIEIDSSGTPQTNVGTAANPPTMPTPTTNRTPIFLLYLPSTAVNTTGTVDSLSAANNNLAKIIDMRKFTQPRDGWVFDNASTWVGGTAGAGGGSTNANAKFAVTGDARSYLGIGTKVGWNDGSNKYGVVAGISFNVTTPLLNCGADITNDKITKTAHGLAATQPVVVTGLSSVTGGIFNTGLYFVINPTLDSNNSFQLATTQGGAAIDFTGSANDTNVTITGASNVSLIINDDYVITATAGVTNTMTQSRYSTNQAPAAFPTEFNFTPVYTGYSAAPVHIVRWSIIGNRRISTDWRGTTNGTSNNTAHTATLPVLAMTLTGHAWSAVAQYVDNGVFQAGTISVSTASSIASLNGGMTNVSNAGGNSRIAAGTFMYEF